MHAFAFLVSLIVSISALVTTTANAGTEDPFAIVGRSRRLSRAEIDRYQVGDPAARFEVLASGVDGVVAGDQLGAETRDAAIDERMANWHVWEFGTGTPTHQTFAAPRGTRLRVREGKNATGDTTWNIGVAFHPPRRGQKAPGIGVVTKTSEPWSRFMSTSFDANLGCGFFDTVCYKGNYYVQGHVLWNFSPCGGCGCGTKDYFALSWHVNVTSKWGSLKRSWVQAHLTTGKERAYREAVYPQSTVRAPTGTCRTGSLNIGVTYGAITVGGGQSYSVCDNEEMGPVAVSLPDGASQWRSDSGLHDNSGASFQGALIFSAEGGGTGYEWWTGHSR